METTPEVTGTKSYSARGNRIKPLASSVDVTGVKLVAKNPAKPGTRFYGFLGGFIGKARRVATVKQIIDAHCAHEDAIGMTRDSIEVVLRDLANYLSAWTDHTKTGSRGLHLRCNRVDGTDVHKTALTAKYEFVSWRADSSFADRARELGWPVA